MSGHELMYHKKLSYACAGQRSKCNVTYLVNHNAEVNNKNKLL